MNMLAMVTSNPFINCLIWLVIAAVLFYLFQWFVGWVGIQEPFLVPAKVVVGLLVVVLIANALLSLVGRGFIPASF